MESLSMTLLSFILILATCSGHEKSNPGNMKTDFEISVNETFKVELTSNPTTGYKWKWTNKESVSVVESFDFDFIPDTPVSDGSGGTEVWKFRGLKSGTDTLKLEYCRPWDSTSTVNTKNIVVKVK